LSPEEKTNLYLVFQVHLPTFFIRQIFVNLVDAGNIVPFGIVTCSIKRAALQGGGSTVLPPVPPPPPLEAVLVGIKDVIVAVGPGVPVGIAVMGVIGVYVDVLVKVNLGSVGEKVGVKVGGIVVPVCVGSKAAADSIADHVMAANVSGGISIKELEVNIQEMEKVMRNNIRATKRRWLLFILVCLLGVAHFTSKYRLKIA
jgi:hypothetical protein